MTRFSRTKLDRSTCGIFNAYTNDHWLFLGAADAFSDSALILDTVWPQRLPNTSWGPTLRFILLAKSSAASDVIITWSAYTSDASY